MEKTNLSWGYYEPIIDEKTKEKKRTIYLNPNSKFFLNYNPTENEYWKVIEGSGTITVKEITKTFKTGDFILFNKEVSHRLVPDSTGVRLCKEPYYYIENLISF